MLSDNTPLVRAFQLAQSGRFATIDDVLKALKTEGYAIAQVNGPSMRKQLKLIIDTARPKAVPPNTPVDSSLQEKSTR
jgi:hypothetical protein